MSTIKDIIDKRKQAAKKHEPLKNIIHGMTIGIDYDDNPQVANRPGFIWVQENMQDGAIFQCFNPSVKLAIGLPVIVSRESGKSSRRVVQSVDWDALAVVITSSDTGKALQMVNHHRDHEFITMFPGLDTVNIYSRAMTQLRLYPGSTPVTISIAPGYYMVDDTTVYYPGLVDKDISAWVPIIVGNYVSLLVYIDCATNLAGFLGGLESNMLYPVDPAISDGWVPLGYVLLYEGMTGIITEASITTDPRPFISIATGAGGVGDMTKAVYDPDDDGSVENADHADTVDAHVHAATDITSGTMDQDRLGSGSGGIGANVLYDDQTWKAAPAGGGTPCDTVSDETSWGILPDEGVSDEYSRGDHTHGSPADPTGVGGSGTVNFVPKFTPDGSTLGDSLIFDDGTFIGIATIVPDGILHIYSDTSIALGDVILQSSTYDDPVAGHNIAWRNSLDEDMVIITGVNDSAGSSYLNIFLYGGDRVRILNNGNVGIGTIVPNQKLDVSGKIALDDVVIAYRPVALTNTLILGNGGTSLAHTALDEGYWNTFVGLDAGIHSTTAYYNTAVGARALHTNTIGWGNEALGVSAMYTNTEGYCNTAMGNAALYYNTLGYENVSVGRASLFYNTTGYENVAIGHEAGEYIADGINANTISHNSVYIGHAIRALADGDDNEIVIGSDAIGAGSNTVVIGNINIAHTYLKGAVHATSFAGDGVGITGIIIPTQRSWFL